MTSSREDKMTTVACAGVPRPVGSFALAVTEEGLAASGWGSAERLRERLGLPEVHDADRTASVAEELRAYFDGRLRRFGTPIDWRLTSGTRRAVLQALYEVPYRSEEHTSGL